MNTLAVRLCPCGNAPMSGNTECWVCVRNIADSGPPPKTTWPLWKDRPPKRTKVSDPVLQIKLDICAELAIPMSLLLARRGRSRIVTRGARKAARRMRNELGMSYPEIGTALGGRHHTTIMYLLEQRHEVSHTAAKAVSK